MSFIVNPWLSSGAEEKWQSRWTIGLKRYGSRTVIERHKRATLTSDGGGLLAYNASLQVPFLRYKTYELEAPSPGAKAK